MTELEELANSAMLWQWLRRTTAHRLVANDRQADLVTIANSAGLKLHISMVACRSEATVCGTGSAAR
jgi:hypothetical protein